MNNFAKRVHIIKDLCSKYPIHWTLLEELVNFVHVKIKTQTFCFQKSSVTFHEVTQYIICYVCLFREISSLFVFLLQSSLLSLVIFFKKHLRSYVFLFKVLVEIIKLIHHNFP